MNYLELEDILSLIPEPNKTIFSYLLNNFPFFYTAKGSSHKHHNWEGGYIDHVTECLNIAITLFESLNTFRTLPFSLEDALIVLFLHDVEKPFLYSGLKKFNDRSERAEYRNTLIYIHNIQLTTEQEVALKYVEGEGQDYHPTQRMMNELGAFCHSCDVLSARLWFNYPLNH